MLMYSFLPSMSFKIFNMGKIFNSFHSPFKRLKTIEI